MSPIIQYTVAPLSRVREENIDLSERAWVQIKKNENKQEKRFIPVLKLFIYTHDTTYSYKITINHYMHRNRITHFLKSAVEIELISFRERRKMSDKSVCMMK